MKPKSFPLIVAVLIILISGCASTQTGTENASALAKSAGEPEPSAAPAMVANSTPPGFDGALTLYSNEPVFQHGQDRTWDQAVVDPGAILFHGGLFHLFYNGSQNYTPLRGGSYDVALQRSAVGYAVSADGIHWYRMDDAPILSTADIGQPLFNARVSSVLINDEGIWIMYLYTQNSDSYQPTGAIWRATAQEPNGPWQVDAAPVLSPGSNNTWDGHAVRFPDVLNTADGYVMYYVGIYDGPSLSPNSALMGMATSPDGVHWTKWDDPSTDSGIYRESDPILGSNMDDGGPRSLRIHRVWQTTEGWSMIFAYAANVYQAHNIGYATSPDGLTWQIAENNPILTADDLREASALGFSDLIFYDNQTYLYFNASKDDTTGDIYLAISP